jgi:hypothetical protein
MVLPLIAAGVGTGASMYFNSVGARERKRAIEDLANQQEEAARWESQQREQEMSRGIREYGGLSRDRSNGITNMLAGYTAPIENAAPVQVDGDPRFALSSVGAPGAGDSWAGNVRQRVGRTLSLQDAVRSNEDRAAAERYQRGSAMGGFQQLSGRLGRQASDYGDLAAIRSQILQNQVAERQAGLARESMKAGQAGSEKMLYGGLAGMAGQMGASFLPMGGGAAAAGSPMPSMMRPGVAPDASASILDPYRFDIARSYGGY